MGFSSGVEEFQLRCALDFLIFVGNLPKNVYNFAETLRIIFLTDFSQQLIQTVVLKFQMGVRALSWWTQRSPLGRILDPNMASIVTQKLHNRIEIS